MGRSSNYKGLPDFSMMGAAELVAWVTNYTLANLSKLPKGVLVEAGWYDSYGVDLYTVTSAGVWIAARDTSGRLTDANSGSISSNIGVMLYVRSPTVGSAPVSAVPAANAHRRISMVNATSNAGGTLDADVNLMAAPTGAYYAVGRVISLQASQNVAAGATLIIQDTTGAIRTVVLPALVANTPTDVMENVYLWGAHDTEPIFLDTTSHDLGNATTFVFTVEYWAET